MKENIIGVIAIVGLLLGGYALYKAVPHFPIKTGFGATTSTGNLLAENYNPYVMYNNGYNSAKDISTTGNINGALGTFSGLVQTDAGQLLSSAVATTTMTSTETLVLADVNAYDTVLLTPNVTGNTTLTLFASSTASTWLPTAGDTQRTCFVNATTTAGVFYTIAGGTGTTLLVASSSVSALGAATIYPQKMGCFNFVRGGATATTFDILGAFTAFK